MKFLFSVLTLVSIFFLASAGNAKAVTFTVTNTSDSGAGSLRQALIDSNATAKADIIVFDPAVFANQQTIILTTGQLEITNGVTVNGPGANLLKISGNNQSRVFYINLIPTGGNQEERVSLNNLTVTGGNAPQGGGIFIHSGLINISNAVISGNKATGNDGIEGTATVNSGGGIYSIESLTIDNTIISGNAAAGYTAAANGTTPGYSYGASGGGIYCTGIDLIVLNSTVTENVASVGDHGYLRGVSADGGGLSSSSQVKAINSVISNNSAIGGDGESGGHASGGGVSASTTLTLLNSTVTGNSVKGGIAKADGVGVGGNGIGGGVNVLYNITLINSTVTDNRATAGTGPAKGAGIGGGIAAQSQGYNTQQIVNATITGNQAENGGGVYCNSAVRIANTIVADNDAVNGKDLLGPFISPGHNIISRGEGSTGLTNGVNGDQVGTLNTPIDPKLAPLGNNGGGTPTRRLLPGSPAIDAGSNTLAKNSSTGEVIAVDQRGLQRIAPTGGTVDIGAFELGAATLPAPAAPALQRLSDTGIESDNITNSRNPSFDIYNSVQGAVIELLRNGTVVASTRTTETIAHLTDLNAPLDGVFTYTSRQTFAGSTSTLSSALAVTFDNTAPTVTVNQSADQSDPAATLPIRFSVVFSEPVVGLDRDDITFTGSTADVSSAFASITGSGATYTVEVSGVKSPGQVVLNVRSGAAGDLVYNQSGAPIVIDNTVTFSPSTIQVAISGKVRRVSGLKLPSPVTILFTDTQTGQQWTARTNPFGYYLLTGVNTYQQIGRTFIVTVNRRTTELSRRLLTISSDTNLTLIVSQ